MPPSPPQRPRRHRHPVGLAAGVIAAVGLLLGACTTPTGRAWLTFFFDGVPPLETEAPPEQLGPPAPRQPWAVVLATAAGRVQMQRHPPYATQQCTKCHIDRRSAPGRIPSFEEMATLRAPVEELCFGCHEPLDTRYVHAPFNLGQCTLCHHPHQSPNQSLLLESRVKELCITCHTPETWPGREAHAEYGGRDCASCHDPHQSDDPMFLKAGWDMPGPEYAVPIGPPAPAPYPAARP